jgi:hypothetical protein
LTELADNRRWDNDLRGHGIADGGWIAPDVRRLLAALTEPDWVAENPDQHLLPRLREACQAATSPWTLLGTELREGVYIVALEWTHPEPRLHRLRADAVALIGVVAEGATFIQQRFAGDGIEYHVTTGLLDGDSPFKGHGHLLRLRIDGSAVKRLIPV